MKGGRFQSYPGGSSVGGCTPAHLAPYLAVDPDWVLQNGSRAQRRRIERELKSIAKSRRWKDGRK